MSEHGNPENPSICPTCGKSIPGDSSAGLCPHCVLGAAAAPSDPGSDAIPLPRFIAPEIEELAAAFPTLEIIELIGCGGMGAVYKARQPHLDREVALKILPQSLAETPEFTERFSREGRLLARLNHPNIVGVYDFGESAGYFFLMMECVNGVNLRQAMRAGKFTPEQALDIVPKVCEALQFAHDEGILHRDIKPENILLDTRGRVKIADFGIAKMVGDVGSPTITRTSAPGTPQYMAPEQIERPDKVDHRADLYSLGVVFYEMLTGELPIGRFAAPSEKAEVGSDIDEIVFRSLEKERERRQQSADEIRTEIAEATQSSNPGREASGSATRKENRHPSQEEIALVRPNIPLVTLAVALGLTGIAFLIALLLVDILGDYHQQKKSTIYQLERRSDQWERDAEQVIGELRDQKPEDHPDIKLAIRFRESLQSQEKWFDQVGRSMGRERLELFHFFLAYCFVVGGISILPTNVFSWKQLRFQKQTGVKKGRARLLIAALAWPVAAITGLVFLIVLFPFALNSDSGGMIGIGISLSLLISLAAAIWMTVSTLRWIKTPGTSRLPLDTLRPTTFKDRKMLRVVLLAFAVAIALVGLGQLLLNPGHRGYYPILFGLMCMAIFWGLIDYGYARRLDRSFHVKRRAIIITALIGFLVVNTFALKHAVAVRSAELWSSFPHPWGIGVHTDWGFEVKDPDHNKGEPVLSLVTRQTLPGDFKVTVYFDGPESFEGAPHKPTTPSETTGVVQLSPGQSMEFLINERDRKTPSFTFDFPDDVAALDKEATGTTSGEKILQLMGGKTIGSTPAEQIWHLAYRFRFDEPQFFPKAELLPLFRWQDRNSSKFAQYRGWAKIEFIPETPQ